MGLAPNYGNNCRGDCARVYLAGAFDCIKCNDQDFIMQLTNCSYDPIGKAHNLLWMISQVLLSEKKLSYVGESTGFISDSVASIYCIAIQIRKAWNFFINPHLLIHRSE